VAALPCHECYFCRPPSWRDVAPGSGPGWGSMSTAIEFGRDRHSALERGSNMERKAGAQGYDLPRIPQIAGGVRCRLIGSTDLEEIAELLHEGFPQRSRKYWAAALQRLDSQPTPEGFPKFGYMLEAYGGAVGVLLLICSWIPSDGPASIRCNVSSWYVRPPFRPYSSLLVSPAIRNRAATYVNVDPDVPTWPIIEAQGFRRVCGGAFASVAMFSLRSDPARVSHIRTIRPTENNLTQVEQRVLEDHDRFGCISICCQSSGQTHPFVFRRRRFNRFPLPCAELIYSRGTDDLIRFKGAIGKFLARRGMFWILVGANGPVDGLIGRYFPDKLPIYSKGPAPPRPGDLAYTEAALFGL
jgi:hypothetical protein